MAQLKASLISASLLLMISTSPITAETDELYLVDVSARYCPAETAALLSLKPDLWNDLGPIFIDPKVTPEVTESWNRLMVSIRSLAEYFGFFLSLSSEENHNTEYFIEAKVNYDLAMCLVPTAEDRVVVEEFVLTNAPDADPSNVPNIFEGHDGFFCMNIDKASDQIFKLDPTSPSFGTDYKSIQSETMKVCEEY